MGTRTGGTKTAADRLYKFIGTGAGTPAFAYIYNRRFQQIFLLLRTTSGIDVLFAREEGWKSDSSGRSMLAILCIRDAAFNCGIERLMRVLYCFKSKYRTGELCNAMEISCRTLSIIVFISHVHDVHGFTAVVVWLDILPYCSICADDVILHKL